ncbi:beta-1,2-xylosyltransferase RCN11 [Nymphaea colorata]|nr:beta-1,2-xylosyltransferase RCN11 [Nymphaea colorata]
MSRRAAGGGVGGSGVRKHAALIFCFCALICLSISFNLFHSHTLLFSSTETPPTVTDSAGKSEDERPPSSLKAWPPLPSFTPWSFDPNLTVGSCEAYFGHGFGHRVDFLAGGAGSNGAGGWFRCFYSDTLRSSVCEGGRIRMDPDRIRMSRGGEDLNSVIGRRDEEELPVYEEGAFVIEAEGEERRIVDEVDLDRFVPVGAVHHHTMRNLIGSIRSVPPEILECSQWIDDPVLLVTRFEYANLFHTVTDWYSSYVASRVTGLPARPRLIFLDGHCKAPIEEAWEALYSSVQYAKGSGTLCLSHAILSPLGYETALFKGLSEVINCHGAPALDLLGSPDTAKTSRLTEFGEMLRASFGLPLKENIPKLFSAPNILFIRREDYLAHPRHSGKVESRLSNEQEVFDALKEWTSTRAKCKVRLVNGLFAHMPFREQVHAIQEASLIIGAHGAGLTHIIAAMPQTIILELLSSLYRRPHFSLISQWRGLTYHVINLQGSHASPDEVMKKVSAILDSFQC